MKSKLSNKPQVDEFFTEAPMPQRELLVTMRKLILATIPDLTESLKWSMPRYSKNNDICYLAIFPKHINFGFTQGAHLDDPNGLLEGTGKGMRHIKIKSAADINKKEFTRILKAAAEYDRANG